MLVVDIPDHPQRECGLVHAVEIDIQMAYPDQGRQFVIGLSVLLFGKDDMDFVAQLLG